MPRRRSRRCSQLSHPHSKTNGPTLLRRAIVVHCLSAMIQSADGLGGFLLVVIDLGELRVDNIVLLARLPARRRASTRPAVARLTFLLRLVHRLVELDRKSTRLNSSHMS